ncbi:MAG: tetratricopeptide repeat protein [Verrucomicrobiota bacterium]
MARQAGTERITEGDPLSKVYQTLGDPTIEFPLKGKLVQEYDQCTIMSRDGVVFSVVYNENATEPVNEPVEEKQSPTILDIKAKAEQGDAESQYMLAYCLQSGKVVTQDYGKAIEWYIKAAMQGHMPSQHNLGVLYMTGKGVGQDYEEAYMWALMAAGNGNDSLLKSLGYKLSQEQKLAGELRAEQIQSELRSPPADSKPAATHILATSSAD